MCLVCKRVLWIKLKRSTEQRNVQRKGKTKDKRKEKMWKIKKKGKDMVWFFETFVFRIIMRIVRGKIFVTCLVE